MIFLIMTYRYYDFLKRHKEKFNQKNKAPTQAHSMLSVQVKFRDVNVNIQDSSAKTPHTLDELVFQASASIKKSIIELVNKMNGESTANRAINFYLTDVEVRTELLEEKPSKKRKLI